MLKQERNEIFDMDGNKKIALVTGATGQDASYLMEYLLSLNYEVHGTVRRSSNLNRTRIDHLHDKITLHYADMSDSGSLLNVVLKVKPDEVYHLAAMSHVRISFDQPEYTADVVGTGTLRLLEAVRILNQTKQCKIYYAGSSEQFGSALPPQTLDTPFHPRSPYGCAKVYGFEQTVNYREAYNIFASCGILFNHDSVPSFTPVILRDGDSIDIIPISKLFTDHATTKIKHWFADSFSGDPKHDVRIWDKDGWVKVTKFTAYYNNYKKPKLLNSASYSVMATSDHIGFDGQLNEKKFEDFMIGDSFAKIDYPKCLPRDSITHEEAYLLGKVCAIGKIDGQRNCTVRLYTDDITLKEKIETLWNIVYYASNNKPVILDDQICCHFDREYTAFLDMKFTDNATPYLKVPKVILNANINICREFLDSYLAVKPGYFYCDSPTMAAGICYLINKIGKHFVLYPDTNNNTLTYRIKYADSTNVVVNNVVNFYEYRGLLYDVTTESGTFHAGVGRGFIHNSPRRPENFFTRKVSLGVASILRGHRQKLTLGNLDAFRDIGFAGDYVKCMHAMLQYEKAEDFIIASGKSFSMRNLVDVAFSHVGLNYLDYVDFDPNLLRPSEVDHLRGDYSKAEKLLGWKPTYDGIDVMKLMVESDIHND